MERLRDMKGAEDATLAYAAKLLASDGPLVPSTARAERVRAALESRYLAPRHFSLALRPALALGILFILVSVASAMVGGLIEHHRMVRAETKRHGGVSMPAVVPMPLSPPPATPLPAVAPPAAEVAPLPQPAQQLPELAPPPLRADRKPTIRHAAPDNQLATAPVNEPPAAQQNSPVPSPEEAALVAQAIKALRQDGDARRAGELVSEYLHRYPAGALEEEALAVGISAAIKRNDLSATELANEYLRKYPAGRFRAVAENAKAHFKK